MTQKRKSLSKVLYMKFIALALDCAVASLGVWLFIQNEDLCIQKNIFIKVTTVCAVIYILVFTFGIFICYNSLGSAAYWDVQSSENSLHFFEKAQHIWRLRLKLFCCCADISESNDLIYVELSSFLASFLNGIDLVPTDILAGIIILSGVHALQKRKKDFQVHPDGFLGERPIPAWMTAENALYYLRIAKSTYGWIAFCDAFHPWNLCSLLSHVRCCGNCCGSSNETKIDDCCFCNNAAVEKITGFTEAEIVYSSFRTSIYEPAFFIAIDHQKHSIIIAIRGTRSFSEIVTAINCEEEIFPIRKSSYKFKCHRGVLRSAINLQKKISELNILNMLFQENPSYTLVITGHSLGGSIAAILSHLYHPEYPELQCYAYAPLAVYSAEGIQETLDFVFSIIVGDDFVPRLCVDSCKKLRVELMKSLEDTKVPKYKILTRTCWYHLKKRFRTPQKLILTEIYENEQMKKDEEIPNMHLERNGISKDLKLYSPGQVLYFKKLDKYESQWITGLDLRNIIISPGMISDHQPHKIQNLLEQHIKDFENNISTANSRDNLGTPNEQ